MLSVLAISSHYLIWPHLVCNLYYYCGLFPFLAIDIAVFQAFFKEFRVVGQICREGMDESGILPKARYAMTVFHCLE